MDVQCFWERYWAGRGKESVPCTIHAIYLQRYTAAAVSKDLVPTFDKKEITTSSVPV